MEIICFLLLSALGGRKIRRKIFVPVNGWDYSNAFRQRALNFFTWAISISANLLLMIRQNMYGKWQWHPMRRRSPAGTKKIFATVIFLLMRTAIPRFR